MKNDPNDQTIRHVERTVAFCGVAFVLIAAGTISGFMGLSVLCGAAIASINLRVISRSVTNLLVGQNRAWALAAVFKFLALLGLIFLLIQSAWVDPFGLAFGFGALPVGILIAGALGAPVSPNSLARSHEAKSDHA